MNGLLEDVATVIEDELEECGHVICAADMAVCETVNGLAGMAPHGEVRDWLCSILRQLVAGEAA